MRARRAPLVPHARLHDPPLGTDRVAGVDAESVAQPLLVHLADIVTLVVDNELQRLTPRGQGVEVVGEDTFVVTVEPPAPRAQLAPHEGVVPLHLLDGRLAVRGLLAGCVAFEHDGGGALCYGLGSAHLLEGVLGAAGPAVEAYPAALTLVLDVVVRYVEISVTEGAEARRTVGEVPAAYARSLVLDARI